MTKKSSVGNHTFTTVVQTSRVGTVQALQAAEITDITDESDRMVSLALRQAALALAPVLGGDVEVVYTLSRGADGSLGVSLKPA